MTLGKKHNQNDFEWGRKQEEKVTPYLREHFHSNLVNSPSQYAKWDYTGDGYKMEMKSRKFAYEKYDTTYLSEDKVKDADDNTYFLFNFVYNLNDDLSDLYFIKYDREKFATFKKRNLGYCHSLLEIPCKDLQHIVMEVI